MICAPRRGLTREWQAKKNRLGAGCWVCFGGNFPQLVCGFRAKCQPIRSNRIYRLAHPIPLVPRLGKCDAALIEPLPCELAPISVVLSQVAV